MRTLVCTLLTLWMALPAAAQGAPSSTALLDAGRRELARRARPAATQSVASTPSALARRSWPARHPVIVGTLAGAGVGFGMLAAQGCGSSDYTCGGLVLFYGGTGAGLGAIGGAVAALFFR